MTRPRLGSLSTGGLVALFAVLALGPLLLLAFLTIRLSTDAVEREARERVASIAAGEAEAVATEMQGLLSIVDSYAARPSLVDALDAPGEPGREGVAVHLEDLQRARPGVAIAFIAAPDGRLVDIVPTTPAIVGEDFSFRDWYRGATSTGEPYLSEAYVTEATGNERVVAAAAVVKRGPRVIGILVAGSALEHLQGFVERFSASHGMTLTITDQRGVVVAAPDTPPGLVSLRTDSRVAAALEGRSGIVETDTERGRRLSAYAPVPEIGWTVVASLPANVAYEGVTTLRRTVLTIAGALALVLLAGVALLGRTLLLRARAERQAEQARRQLAQRNDELEEARDELESQNAELEAQTAELEDQQARLESAKDKLEAQAGELAGALDELAEQKDRIETLFSFGELLAAEVESERLAETVLREIADFAGAEIGTLHAFDEERGAFCLLAARGVTAGSLPDELRDGEGLPGRAIAEGRTVVAGYGETGLRLAALGEEIAVRHELHLPLRQGERMHGVISLARVGDREFEPHELEAIEHLADQSAVALGNVLAYCEAQRLAGLNQAVLDATRDGIRLVDLEGKIVLANAAMGRLAREALELPEEGTIYERSAAIAERTADPDAYRAALAAIEEDPEREALDEYTVAESGRSFQRYTAPVRSESGDLIGRIFVLREVTSEREAERLKSELMATVSHELRTPLASILGFAELLVLRDVDGDTGRRYLNTIHSEARRLTDLINDFLDLQRIEAGRFRLELEPFGVAELLAHQVEVFSGQSTRHRLHLTVGDGPLTVLGERDRIAQVVGNLLSNAIKYSPAGGTVSVEAKQLDGVVRVAVADQGLGIPQAQQHGIFQKFFRADSSDTREIGGTGLGLALSREIVEAHGGRMGFESEEGRGSTFWLELPASEHGNGHGHLRALIVEDDPIAATLLAECLAEDGLEVVVAASGERALELASEERLGLVCLDIALGGEMDGWEVLAQLKAHPRTAAIPVVICTGNNGRDRAATLGAADFIAKPFSAEQLRETVMRVVGHDGASVLVVDDDAAVRSLVRESLAGDGLTLREAAEGESALLSAAEDPPDAIVLDLVMPGVDGFEVLDRLQSDPTTRSIPVIVLTGRRLTATERRLLSDRAASLLQKNAYSALELRRLVRSALGR